MSIEILDAGVTWDYENGPDYYHIFAVCGRLDGAMEAWGIEVQQTDENDEDVNIIVAALNRIARRNENA